MRLTVPVGLRVNEASLSEFRRRVLEIIHQQQSLINVSLTANNNNNNNGGQRRVGSNALTQDELSRMAEEARIDRILAMNARDRARATLDEARALEIRNDAQLQSIRLQQALARLDEVAANRDRAQERYRQVQYKTADLQTRISDRESRRQAREDRRQNGTRVGTYNVSDLQKSLQDPDLPLATKMQNLNTLIEHNKQISQEAGQNFTKSFTILQRNADSSVSSLRTMTYEFTKFGEAVERGDRSLGSVFNNMTRHFAFHATIAAGFYKITESIMQSVEVMKEFESEFLKVQNLADSRNQDYQKANPSAAPSDMPFSNSQAQQDVFNLGKRYGVDPTKDILPVYTDILRRKDLVKNNTDARLLTQIMIRAGIVSHGGDATAENFEKSSEDMTAIYQQMQSVWQGQGKNPQQQLSLFVDRLAKMRGEGADIDKTLEALGDDIVPYVKDKKNGLDLNYMASVIGSSQLVMGDASGSEISSVIKLMINNLTKTRGSGSLEARRILGLTTNPDASAMEIFQKITSMTANEQDQAMGVLLPEGDSGSEAVLSNLARNTASSGGQSGGARRSQVEAVINAMRKGNDFYQIKDADVAGLAENVAQRQGQTLNNLLGKLNASFQEMSVSLGNTGLLDALKTVTRAITVFVDGLNGIFSVIAKFHDAITTAFGDDFSNSITTIMTAGLAIKGASVVQKAIFHSGAGSALGEAALQGVTSAGTESVLSKLLKTGGTAVVGTAETGILSKVVSLFGKLGTGLEALIPIITKLGIVGAVVGVVAAGVGAIYDYNKSKFDKRAFQTTSDLSDPTVNAQVKKDMNRLTELNGGYVNETDIPSLGQSIKSLGTKDFWSKAYSMLGDIFHTPTADEIKQIDGPTPDPKELKSIQDRLAKYGITQYNSGPGVYEMAIKDAAGNSTRRTFDTRSQKDMSALATVLDSLTSKTSEAEEMWRKWSNTTIDQFKVLGEIKDLSDNVDARKGFLQLADSVNSIKFQGATDSASFFDAQIKSISSSMSDLSDKFNHLAQQRKDIADAAKNDNLNVTEATVGLLGVNGGSDAKAQIDTEFASAVKNGQINTFFDKYRNVTNDSPEIDKAKSKYAFAIRGKEMNREIIDNINTTQDNIVSQFTQNIDKLKQLHSQFLLAAAGVNVFDYALKQSSTTLQQLQYNYSNAVGEQSKIGASVNIFGEQAKQVRMYTDEISGLQVQINRVKAQNPNTDFSLGALLNPGADGLSSPQADVKAMMDRQNELRNSQAQSLQALKQQSDQVSDLVLNTVKYKSAWDSVNTYGCQVMAVPASGSSTSIGSSQVQVLPGVYQTSAGHPIVFTGGTITLATSGNQVVYLNPTPTGGVSAQLGVTGGSAPAGSITLATVTGGTSISQAMIVDNRPANMGYVNHYSFELANVDITVPVKQSQVGVSATGGTISRTMYMEKCFVNNVDFNFQTQGVATASYRLETDNKRWFLNNSAQVVVDQFKSAGGSTLTLSQTPNQLNNGKYTLKLFKNGTLLSEGTGLDYTVSGTTVTFTTALSNGDLIKVRYVSANGGSTFNPYPAIENPHPQLAGGIKEGQVEIYLSDSSARLTRVQSARISLPMQRDKLVEMGSLSYYDRPMQLPVTANITLELKDTDLELFARLAGQTFSSVNEISISDLLKNMSLSVKLYRENDITRTKLPSGHPNKYAIKVLTINNLVPASENWSIRVSSDGTQTYEFTAHNIAIDDQIVPGSI